VLFPLNQEQGYQIIVDGDGAHAALGLGCFEDEPFLRFFKGALDPQRLICHIEVTPSEGQDFVSPRAGKHGRGNNRVENRRPNPMEQLLQFVCV
jgi:hypothetical protein